MYNDSGSFGGSDTFIFNGNNTITLGEENSTFNIKAADAVTGSGTSVVMTAGAGLGTGAGGSLSFISGAGGSSGSGGSVNLTASTGVTNGTIVVTSSSIASTFQDGGLSHTFVTVTQPASAITNTVNINPVAMQGVITTQSATAGAGSANTFTVTNNLVTNTSSVVASVQSYTSNPANNSHPIVTVTRVDTGEFDISIVNAGTDALNNPLTIMWMITGSF
jgi:hypothetical protein